MDYPTPKKQGHVPRDKDKKSISNSKSAPNGAKQQRAEAEKAAFKAKVRNDLQRQQSALKRQKELSEKILIWSDQILPNWEMVSMNKPKIRDLCMRGIPPNIRGRIWPLLIGNELNVRKNYSISSLLKSFDI